jgi:hypothetical protein
MKGNKMEKNEHKYVNYAVETLYTLHGTPIEGPTTTQMFATCAEEAKQLMKERKLGERFEPMHMLFRAQADVPFLPSELFEKGEYVEAMHAACWLGFVACSSGTATGQELLDDNGVIHNLAHMCLPKQILDNNSQDYVKAIHDSILPKLKALEAKTPGFKKYLTKEEFETAKEGNKKHRRAA